MPKPLVISQRWGACRDDRGGTTTGGLFLVLCLWRRSLRETGSCQGVGGRSVCSEVASTCWLQTWAVVLGW